MKNGWLESRKDIFERDLFQDFFEAKQYFESLLKTYRDSATIPYSMMDSWVGSETAKGPLWHLKDQSHQLFRHNNSFSNNLYEYLFDWAIGSIFHEAMKLKEDAYQVDSYRPLLDYNSQELQDDSPLSVIIKEYCALIERAQKNLQEELESIEELFNKAVYHLREMLISKKDNMLLVRFLLDSKNTIINIIGGDSYYDIFHRMFPDGPLQAYEKAARECYRQGWYDPACRYFEKILSEKPDSPDIKDLLKSAREKQSEEIKKEELERTQMTPPGKPEL